MKKRTKKLLVIGPSSIVIGRASLALLLFLPVASYAIHNWNLQSALLRSDANDVPQQPTLMHVAVTRGEPVFAARCAACHGASGTGDPSRGVPNLADSDWLYGSGTPDDIERTIAFGIRAHNSKTSNLAIMPAFGRPVPLENNLRLPPLSPPEISDVTDYLLSLQHHPPDPEAAARGRAIFADRGGCYDCHGRDARGDAAVGAPNLADAIWLFGDGSRQSIIDSITYGRQGFCPAWFGRLPLSDIRNVALFVYSLSPHDTETLAEAP